METCLHPVFSGKSYPKVTVGMHSIGVDTIVGRYPISIIGNSLRLGKDSVLNEAPENKDAPNFILNEENRLGSKTFLN